MGESGCGKSTLARIAVGLLRPSSGNVYLEGTDLYTKDSSFQKSLPTQVQMIFQDPYASLNPRLTVGSSIGEALLYQGVAKKERRDRVQTMLELVGLEAGHAQRYPHEFSGGQRQRLAIARALLLRPQLVVCDEPVSSLDASIQAQVLNLLKDLQDTLQLTYVFISHDLTVVSHMSDRVAVMYLGHLVELAPSSRLFSAPQHPYTQALLASLPGAANCNNDGASLSGELPSPLFPPSGCVFHPAACTLCLFVKSRFLKHFFLMSIPLRRRIDIAYAAIYIRPKLTSYLKLCHCSRYKAQVGRVSALGVM